MKRRMKPKKLVNFFLDNKRYIHSVELFYFVAYRHTPMVRNPEKFGITIHKQDDYDMPLDYYYTLNEPGGLTCLDAMKMAEEFYQKDFEPWAVRVNAREHVFLYISKVWQQLSPANLCLGSWAERAYVPMVFKDWSLGRWPMGQLRRMGPGNRECPESSAMRLPDPTRCRCY